MKRTILVALVALVVLWTAPLLAQTVVPVLPDCRVVAIHQNYPSDGDWRLTVRCEPNGTQKPIVGDKAQVTRIVVTQVAPTITAFVASPSTITLGKAVTFTCAATGTPAPTLTVDQGVGACPGTKAFTPTAAGTLTFVLSANNGISPVALRSLQVRVDPIVAPVDGPIFGIVDPAVLGECSAATHDTHVVPGGDGYRYRTWHPQVDPSGCTYAHEHGDNPAIMANTEIASEPVRFGYIGRRHPMPDEPNGHEEPHEGFKVFISNIGDVNDENRVNRAFSRSVFHMGSGGPRRFSQRFHSADIRVIHPEFGLKAFTKLMMDTGATGRVCAPRSKEPVKDVIALDFVLVCGEKLGSSYEIWSTFQDVRNAVGDAVYRAFATPALFDPITVLNPSNPLEVVYAWDPRVVAIKEFPSDTWWDQFRGCNRESYAQPGYWYNQGQPTVYYTDAMGQPMAATHPLAIRQDISSSASIGAPTTNDGLGAFKQRIDYCTGQQYAAGKLIPRPGIPATSVNKAKLGLKN